MAGRTSGILMLSAILSSPQPSSLAASYTSGGIERNAVNTTIMLNPAAPHTTTLATEKKTDYGLAGTQPSVLSW